MEESGDLDKLNIDDLKALLAKEESEKQKLTAQLSNLENEVQNTTLDKERQEERILNIVGKKIKELKQENAEMAQKIQKEEEYIKSTLKDKYKAVLRDKEILEETLNYQEQQVIDHLQLEIDRMTQEATDLEAQLRSHEIDNIPFERDKVDASIAAVLKESQKNKNDYEKELATLRKEVERMITANSLMFKRISALQLELISKQKSDTETEIVYTPEFQDEKNRRFSDIPENTMRRRRSAND
ncbi:hypothetical protein TRFO_26163 [Tritrichomonas foetus]|uniref:Uncharacterized protein n=1 Tax=Tritrichomonas foetus TaxID=1144522 RepID=A0A1J4K8B2_9EUKA|nr:hypothetical protein TRFO_26163 [Tritrichomonas foetus]|eukprot:OHT05948.1 hypothetical protein TRFO_26163 [Tritrichomonas foetus]